MAKRKSYIFMEDQRSHWLRKTLLTLLFLLLALALGLFAVSYGISHDVTLERVTVTVPDLPADLEQWSILLMSDLHGATLGRQQSGIRRAIEGVNMSVIVFMGDMVGPGGDIQPLLDIVSFLPKDKIILYVPGDEDFDYLDGTAHANITAKADWALALEQAGVTIVDVPVLFTRGANNRSRIWFIPEYLYSLDCDNLERMYQAQLDALNAKASLTADEVAMRRVAEYEIARAQKIRLAKSEIRKGDIQVALSHVPVTQSYMDSLILWGDRNTEFSLLKADLILAGHYCGGQWRVPGRGAIYVPQLGFWPEDRLIRGLDYIGAVPQYISPGLGASGIYPYFRFRVMNQPVVTYLTLTSRQQ